MGKKSVTVRMEEATVDLLDGYARDNGITRTEAAERAVVAFLRAPEAPDGPGRGNVPDVGAGAVVEALVASNADLRAALVDTRATVATLTAQMAVKDEQIARAHELVDQAHRLQMAEVQRALPPARGHRAGRGLLARILRLQDETESGSNGNG